MSFNESLQILSTSLDSSIKRIKAKNPYAAFHIPEDVENFSTYLGIRVAKAKKEWLHLYPLRSHKWLRFTRHNKPSTSWQFGLELMSLKKTTEGLFNVASPEGSEPTNL